MRSLVDIFSSVGKTLRKGDEVEDFQAVAHNGARVSLSEMLALGPVVVFFYPRAMSPGCTRESCHFRDLSAEFGEMGASVVGVSADGEERLARFRRSEMLDFVLLSDPDREIVDRFGVFWLGGLFSRRVTFVISEDAVVLDVIRSETSMHSHADKALAVLRNAGRV